MYEKCPGITKTLFNMEFSSQTFFSIGHSPGKKIVYDLWSLSVFPNKLTLSINACMKSIAQKLPTLQCSFSQTASICRVTKTEITNCFIHRIQLKTVKSLKVIWYRMLIVTDCISDCTCLWTQGKRRRVMTSENHNIQLESVTRNRILSSSQKWNL